MTGDKNEHGVGRTGAGHGAYRLGPPDRLGDFAIRARLPVGDLLQFFPDASLKRCALNVHRRIKTGALPLEVLQERARLSLEALRV